eukprot:Opistho-2@7295
MQNIIFFDGVCNLCNGAVQFAIQRDNQDIFRFASLQSDVAATELAKYGINPNQLNSIVLLEDGKVYQQSTAALRIARRLNNPWPLLYAFILVPKFIRDGVYRFIAKYRYKWFGKKESCWVPTAGLKRKFL